IEPERGAGEMNPPPEENLHGLHRAHGSRGIWACPSPRGRSNRGISNIKYQISKCKFQIDRTSGTEPASPGGGACRARTNLIFDICNLIFLYCWAGPTLWMTRT